MEMLDIYLQDGQKSGRVVERGCKDLSDNEFIKLAVVWIKCKDKYLIQKGSVEKGSEFAVTGGHVTSGNTGLEQAIIEIEEELGVNVPKNKFKMLGRIFIKHAMFEVYLLEDKDFNKYQLKLQESEVDNVHWLTKREIENLIDSGNFRKSSGLQYDEFIKGMYV